jgi:hypothetical protein
LDTLPESVWRKRRARHAERLSPFANERLERMARREKHPVHDFLFEYYSFRPAHLVRWSPGPGVVLENAVHADIEWKGFESTDSGLILPATSFPAHRVDSARWALTYLQRIAARPPLFGCFGMHEWAMVYRTDDVRHSRTPLRLSPTEIESVVESADVCCTHFDAFRFFTPAAMPRNRLALTRDSMDHLDQRGCIHVTMDLYRHAFKIAPWVSGELIADAFELAWQTRQLDMRASPYDLTSFGLQPICIETSAGKEEYVREQRALAAAATPLRARLIEAYQRLLAEGHSICTDGFIPFQEPAMVATADRPTAAELDRMATILSSRPIDRAELTKMLRRIEQGLRAHGDELDRTGGLLDETDRADRAGLDREDIRLRDEVTTLIRDAQVIRQESGAGGDETNLIERATSLMTALRGHRDAESSLVLENADGDVGAGD